MKFNIIYEKTGTTTGTARVDDLTAQESSSGATFFGKINIVKFIKDLYTKYTQKSDLDNLWKKKLHERNYLLEFSYNPYWKNTLQGHLQLYLTETAFGDKLSSSRIPYQLIPPKDYKIKEINPEDSAINDILYFQHVSKLVQEEKMDPLVAEKVAGRSKDELLNYRPTKENKYIVYTTRHSAKVLSDLTDRRGNIKYYVHPKVVDRYSPDGFDRASPTASTRTVLVTTKKNDCYAKTSLEDLKPFSSPKKISEWDAIYSLKRSCELQSIFEENDFAYLREILAISDKRDCATIIRETKPYPYVSDDRLLLPLFSLKTLVPEIAERSGKNIDDIYLEIASKVVNLWGTLAFKYKQIIQCPHAQNIMIELDKNYDIKRVVLKDLLDVADIEEYTYKTSHLPTEIINRKYLNSYYLDSRFRDSSDIIVDEGPDTLTKSEILKYSYDMLWGDILTPFGEDLQEHTGRTKVLELEKKLLETFWDTILEGAKKVGTEIEYEKVRNNSLDKLRKEKDITFEWLDEWLDDGYQTMYSAANKLFSTEL